MRCRRAALLRTRMSRGCAIGGAKNVQVSIEVEGCLGVREPLPIFRLLIVVGP